MKRVLGLFAKKPEPGAVKTRLAAASGARAPKSPPKWSPRSPEWAAEVYNAFLLDALERLSTLKVERVLAFTPEDARSWFEPLAGEQWQLVPQTGEDLGRRMAAFFSGCFAAGAHAAVLLGADSPTLPLGHVAQAFAELSRADLVLGPATDGGYYLIGCVPPVPAIFDGVDWGTDPVLEQTVARVQRNARRLALLPPWYDVDTIEDWHCLRGHLAALRAAGIDPKCPRTEALLAREPATNR